MADLAKALDAMFSGGDMTIFQGTVDAVGEGIVTVHYNGGTFTDVPYLANGFPLGSGFGPPDIGDACYVIGRKNWGLLVLGAPAPGPTRSAGDPQVMEWDPDTIGIYNQGTGTWTVPVSDEMPVTYGYLSSVSATYFYDPADIGWDGETLATASFFLEYGDVDTFGEGVDNAYVTVGLLSGTGPGTAYQEMANLNVSLRGSTSGGSSYVSIPLDWASRLLSGEAHGIFVRTEEFPMTISGPGTIRITTL